MATHDESKQTMREAVPRFESVREVNRGPRSCLTILLAVAVLLIAALGALLWCAHRMGARQRGSSDRSVRTGVTEIVCGGPATPAEIATAVRSSKRLPSWETRADGVRRARFLSL